ncbi:tetratricopeptide repeat protein [Eisenibacter elegans]|uniref:tetratricopeptide repeat protein n=1 Tax=Eisenibacter elegans TaxID=997 RepID=UPI00047BB0BA|nr:tetratricopeptide repeat protein [Eisenibacter elegans]
MRLRLFLLGLWLSFVGGLGLAERLPAQTSGRSVMFIQDTAQINALNRKAWEWRSNHSKQAIVYAEQAKEKAIAIQYYEGLAYAYMYAGVAHNYAGSPLKAMQEYEMALKIFKKQGLLYGQGFVLNLLGEYHMEAGDNSIVLNLLFESLEIRKRLRDDVGLGHTLKNIGKFYFQNQEYLQALKYHQQALALRERIQDARGLADSYNYLGEVFLIIDSLAQATVCFKKALSIHQAHGHQAGVAISLNFLGRVNSLQNKPAIAATYLHRALAINQDLNHEEGILRDYQGLGQMSMQQKQWEQAADYLLIALNIALRTGFKKYTRDLYADLVTCAEARQDYALALAYHKNYSVYRDSLRDEITTQRINDARIRYQSAEKDRQIQELNAQHTIQTLQLARQKDEIIRQYYIILSLVLLVLLVSVAGYFWRKANKRIRRYNHLLQLQRLHLRDKNEQISTQEKLLRQQQHDYLSSLNNAKRIQHAILPSMHEIRRHIPELFVLNLPKNIVSGDFYWFTHLQLPNQAPKTVLACVDCTGHGVPGAFMSLVGNDLLDQIVRFEHHTQPTKILTELNNRINHVLKKKELDNIEGMEIGLCVIDEQNQTLTFAGANLPMVYFQNGKMQLFKGTPQPAGGLMHEQRQPFEEYTLLLNQPTQCYLFSDGYKDQFNGQTGRKISVTQFKELLSEVHHLPLEEQSASLFDYFMKWKGEHAQIDDVLLIGFKLGCTPHP